MAGKFEYAYDLSGTTFGVVKEFYIASGTVIEKGEMVKLVEGAVVAIGDVDQDDPYLGVAAEDHDGVTEFPGSRQTGNKIKVYCSPTAVFRCKPDIKTTADSGSATTWVDDAFGTIAADKFNGGYLKLKSATALTDYKNKAVRITDFATTSGTFTGVFTGGVTAGDVAIVLPPVGSIGWDFNADGTNLDLKANGGESIVILDVDTDLELVYFMLRLHQFGNHMIAI